MGTPLAQAIDDIYARHDRHILPFVGDAYVRPAPKDFRILVVGLNAYVDDEDLRRPAKMAGWLGGWFERGQHRFYPAAYKNSVSLADELIARSRYFEGLLLRGKDSFYLTNAIKVFLSTAEGKESRQLTTEHFERHLDQWRDELDVLAEHGVLPHLLVVFGEQFWKYACSTFQAGSFKHLRVLDFEWTPGPSRHHVNRITVEGESGPRVLLLVRCAHPAARSRKGRPAWLLKRADFRELAGLPGSAV